MVEWNGIFRLFRFSGILGQPREVHPKFRNEIRENDCSIRPQTRNFRNFWSNGKRPKILGLPASRRMRGLGRVRLGSIRNKNSWNNASKRLFASYSHSGIPGFPFRLFCSQEQNSRNIFRNIFLFRNIPNERTLGLNGV